MPDILGTDVELGPGHPHGANIHKKLHDGTTLADAARSKSIQDVAMSYLRWRAEAEALTLGVGGDLQYVAAHTGFYRRHRDLLDEPAIDTFDARGALQSSALEEFCTFLFSPALGDFEHEIAIGHLNVYQGLHFTAGSFSKLIDMPTPHYPVGNIDFAIGKKLVSRLESDVHQSGTHVFIPAIAVECKTYLDRPRFVESDNLSASIKVGFPQCLYVVLSEFLKLDLSTVNVVGSQIDRIYVLRRARNIDRSKRRSQGLGLPPLHTPAVLDFFRAVRSHLDTDWEAPEDWTATGILK